MALSGSNVTTLTPRGPSASTFLNPLTMAANLWRRRELTNQFVRREIQGRYKGSYLGLFWSMANPLLLLGVFTFVFHYIFGSTWTRPDESVAVYALNLYSGMIIFS